MEVFLKGVYFLYDGDEIVYVGKSGDIYRRIYEHSSGRAKGEKKKFDSWKYVRIDDEDERAEFEEICINMFRPKYNIDRRTYSLTVTRKSTIAHYEKKEGKEARELYDYMRSISPEDLDRYMGIQKGTWYEAIYNGMVDKRYLIKDNLFHTRISNDFIVDYGERLINYKKEKERKENEHMA